VFVVLDMGLLYHKTGSPGPEVLQGKDLLVIAINEEIQCVAHRSSDCCLEPVPYTEGVRNLSRSVGGIPGRILQFFNPDDPGEHADLGGDLGTVLFQADH